MQFRWQFFIINSCFWLVNILLQEFDTLSNKDRKTIKQQIYGQKQQKNTKKQKNKKNKNENIKFLILNTLHWPVI